MTSKKNPLKLNPLQLKALTLFQVIAQIPQATVAGPGEGEITINRFPQAHADHFHLGEYVVMGKDANGVFMENVWHALERKGLAKANWPQTITMTQEGLTYDTGMAEEILHKGGGH